MRYAIIANPASGKMSANEKRFILAEAAKVLDAEIHGMDTTTIDEFNRCAKEVVTGCDILVAAGGDGTFSDVINAIDTTKTPIAYLPLGTGNAMGYALHYKKDLTDIAIRIRDGKIREYDLINCDNRVRAFTVSIGIEGDVVRIRGQYVSWGGFGLKSYVKAVVVSYFRTYNRAEANIIVDGNLIRMKNLLSLMIVKQPYYGFGMKVVPKARFDDRKLHLVAINAGLCGAVIGAISAFTIGNRIGQYRGGLKVDVSLDRVLTMQYDGNEGWESERFSFSILPGALKIKC
jgi:diacylglycerol kinase family enzyme